MKALLKVISFLALAGVLGAAIAFFIDRLSLEHTKIVLLLSTVLWFATAPFWMEHRATD